MQADKFGNDRRINQTQFQQDRKLARLVAATMSLSTNLNPSAFKKATNNEQSVKIKNQWINEDGQKILCMKFDIKL